MKRGTAFILSMALLCMALVGCGGKAPKAVVPNVTQVLLNAAGESYALSVATEGVENAPVNYVSSATGVAEVSGSGVITATGSGIATITVSAAADESVYATVDVMVTPFLGVYTAEKYIDAMGCDVRVRLTLLEDGTYTFYRYPMYVDLAGGGDMPELTDQGSFLNSGAQFDFKGELLGAFSLTFQAGSEGLTLQGSVPTGGASTQLQLVQNSLGDGTENGVYSSAAETADGTALRCTLTLKSGDYVFTVNNDTVSSGSYSFSGSTMEFAAAQGDSFMATYNADRGTVESLSFPCGEGSNTSATLQREG